MTWLSFVIAIVLMIPIDIWMNKANLKARIKDFNKRNPDMQLDENTKLSVFNRRYRDWQLAMFCDKVEKENKSED